MKIDVYAVVRVTKEGPIGLWSPYIFTSREGANEHMHKRGWPQMRYGMGTGNLAIQKLNLCVDSLELMKAVAEAEE